MRAPGTTGRGAAYAVDLEALDVVLADMRACDADLEAFAAQVEAHVRRLHEGWAGEAAAAQLVAQRSWEDGFAQLREALRQMRAAGRTAHANYSAAVEANVAMWGQLG